MGKEDALKCIAEHTAAICNHSDVFPCTMIARCIGESVYKVRKYMKELEAEGYVVKAHDGGVDDWSATIYCIHGYSLTAKGAETQYYKDKYEEEKAWWAKHI